MAKRKLTLSDLASGATGGSSGSGSNDGDGSGGEWMVDLFDRLDEGGYIDMFASHYLGEPRPMDEIKADHDATEAPQNDGQPSIDAEKAKELMLQLYDLGGRVPGLSDDPKLSEIIQLVDANPEMANNLMEDYL